MVDLSKRSITPEMTDALVYAMEIHRQHSPNNTCTLAPWCALTTVKENKQFLCAKHNGVSIDINDIKDVLKTNNKETSHVHTIYSLSKRWQTVCIPMDINGMPMNNRIHSLWSIDIQYAPQWQIRYTGTPIVSLGGYNCDTLMDTEPARGGVAFRKIDQIGGLKINVPNTRC
jgi:hypothetical protein